jgi:hypothetical protein
MFATFLQIYFCRVFNHLQQNHPKTPLDKIFQIPHSPLLKQPNHVFTPQMRKARSLARPPEGLFFFPFTLYIQYSMPQ